jgi:uncharacterized protein (TIGR00661 family)
MKIFYAVQATGNGHISRAIEILPYLQAYGEVDIFLSGSNYSLKSSLPVAYRSKGLSLQYAPEKGSVDLLKTVTSISVRKIWNEAKFLPIEKYDLVINDFEFITSLACKLKKVRSVHLGHQASFFSKNVPRPKKRDLLAEWIFTHYAQATETYGLHFKEYDKNIFQPIIRSSIVNANPKDGGHITVYLGHFNTQKIIETLGKITDYKFEVFCSEAKSISVSKNIKVLPINHDFFSESLINSHGIITGAGFETPAEALYLGKKVLTIPVKGQYEQLCNAEALKEFNVPVIEEFNNNFLSQFRSWISKNDQKELIITKSTKEIIRSVVEKEGNNRPQKPAEIHFDAFQFEQQLLAVK